jgi:MFS family permease
MGMPGLALYVAVVMFGLALGAEFDLMSFMVSRYQGLASYGKIYGTVFGVFSAGAALGPISLGWSYDNLGGYGPLLTAFAGLMVIVIVLIATLGPYRWQVRKDEPSHETGVAGTGTSADLRPVGCRFLPGGPCRHRGKRSGRRADPQQPA